MTPEQIKGGTGGNGYDSPVYLPPTGQNGHGEIVGTPEQIKAEAKDIMCANLIASEETTDDSDKAEKRPKVILSNLDDLIDLALAEERKRVVEIFKEAIRNAPLEVQLSKLSSEVINDIIKNLTE